eukprot:m.142572 g.142572  ORF g.142572 m.142572 type:complete len:188 (-) comp9650_c1_seq5:170-733(-)
MSALTDTDRWRWYTQANGRLQAADMAAERVVSEESSLFSAAVSPFAGFERSGFMAGDLRDLRMNLDTQARAVAWEGTILESQTRSDHLVYKVRIALGEAVMIIFRRYSEFETLSKQVKSFVAVPARFPPKAPGFFVKPTAEFLERRLEDLQAYLAAVLQEASRPSSPIHAPDFPTLGRMFSFFMRDA